MNHTKQSNSSWGASEDENMFVDVEVKEEDHPIQVKPKYENESGSNLPFSDIYNRILYSSFYAIVIHCKKLSLFTFFANLFY